MGDNDPVQDPEALFRQAQQRIAELHAEADRRRQREAAKIRPGSDSQGDRHVREHVRDLLAHRQQDHDDDHRDKDQDQRVFDHPLAQEMAPVMDLPPTLRASLGDAPDGASSL
jgi:hypothetical protein